MYGYRLGYRASQGSLLNPYVPKYFVDSVNGLDANDGLSEDTAWKTLTKVNSATYTSGDSVGFKGGQSFTGTLTPKNGVTYGTYGLGAKAIITQSAGSAVDMRFVSNSTIQYLDIRYTGVTTTEKCIELRNSGNKIKRCKITSSGYGIISSTTLSNIEIESNIINVTGSYAIYLYGTGSSNITCNQNIANQLVRINSTSGLVVIVCHFI